MMNYFFSISIALVCLGIAVGCQQKTVGDQSSGFDYDLLVAHDSLRLWAEAGANSDVLAWLPPGAKLQEAGGVSDFTSRIQLGGKNYDEPWIKVRTEFGNEGWVYAKASDFQFAARVDSVKWTHEKRLLSFLGPQNVDSLVAYNASFRQIRSLADFIRVYRDGLKLREVIVQRLEDKITQRNIDQLPDLFWLGEEILGFTPQLVAEGLAYHLFADYRRWLEQARLTEAPEDDAFVDFCISLFPQDSIEYFYPVWKIQTWDYGGHSLLGRGHHYRVLRAIDQLSRQTKVFEPELRTWKETLIDDITDVEVTYWEKQDLALRELNQVMSAGFSCLSRADKIALETRREQMENANKYGVEFNHQAGLY